MTNDDIKGGSVSKYDLFSLDEASVISEDEWDKLDDLSNQIHEENLREIGKLYTYSKIDASRRKKNFFNLKWWPQRNCTPSQLETNPKLCTLHQRPNKNGR